jgi:hypothetical protein
MHASGFVPADPPVVDGLPFYRQETVDLFRGANLHAATKNSRVSTP